VFLAVVDILQAIDFHLSGSDAVEGLKKIRQYVTVLDDKIGPPKAQVNQLLPSVRPKVGRPKAPTRGLTYMELAASNKGKRSCGFCLASDHREGSNCPKLQALKMNLKLTRETMTLVSDVSKSTSCDVTPSDDITASPKFVHIKEQIVTISSNGLKCVHLLCDLYRHSAESLGTFCVTMSLVSKWIAQPRVGVFLTSVPKTRKELRETILPLSNDVCSPIVNVNMTSSSTDKNLQLQVSRHVARLRAIWDKRSAHEHESWKDSRIARVTGTSARYVMGRYCATTQQVSQVLGLKDTILQPTRQMQIGTILESQILAKFCERESLHLCQDVDAPSLTLLERCKYVGHTPDGLTASEVLEVKVVFSTIDIEILLKRHVHQLQLGLWVHKSKQGRLIVYECPCKMSVKEAREHQIDLMKLRACTFTRDRVWYVTFQDNVAAFYKEHLAWFYSNEFDMQYVTSKITQILTRLEVDRCARSNKRNLIEAE
jgi:hypothetical protein